MSVGFYLGVGVGNNQEALFLGVMIFLSIRNPGKPARKRAFDFEVSSSYSSGDRVTDHHKQRPNQSLLLVTKSRFLHQRTLGTARLKVKTTPASPLGTGQGNW